MTINFAINSNCEIYLADTCTINRTRSDAPYWLKYKSIVKSSSPVVIPASEIASWANRLDEEGCFYGLFYTTANSTNRKLTITTTAPAESDPVYPTTTVTVACDINNRPFVEVSATQTVTVEDETGTIVKTFTDAVPDAKYSLSDLPAGKYTLRGQTEIITVNL
jgi:hypothetical protein